MTIAMEPLLYTDEPRLGGHVNVGIEKNVVITGTGYEVLGEPQTQLQVVK